MQAIRTRYYGPTDYRGSRIVADCDAGRVTMPYRYDLNTDGNHEAACGLLLDKLGWRPPVYRPMAGGYYRGDFYWVFASDDPADPSTR